MPSFGSRDSRDGSGRPVGDVVMPTLLIPERCHDLCTWSVVRPGPGYACLSRLRYRNLLCPASHDPAGGLEVTSG